MSHNPLAAPDPRAAVIIGALAAVPAVVIITLAVLLNWGR